MRIYQTHVGYIFKDIDKVFESKIKEDLTVCPKTYFEEKKTKPFKIYAMSKGYLIVPRYYVIEHLQDVVKTNPIKIINRGIDIDCVFKGTLRENQKPIIKKMMEGLKTEGGGIINAPCGTGKTAMADYLICALKKKALIIVHNEYLLDQHIERLKQFTNAKVGIIRGKDIDIDGKDVVIGMLQSISMKTFPKGTFDCFGTVIVDECHHIGARVFSKALFKISTTYMIGLSATPERKDGLSCIFKWFLGPIRFKGTVERNTCVQVKMVQFTGDKKYLKTIYNVRKKASVPQMITKLTEYEKRTTWILNKIFELSLEERNILVLSDRRKHVKEIVDKLNDMGVESGAIVGETTKKGKELRKQNFEKQVIVGTYKMVSEGFDCNRLDTLIMASPIKDITQAVGRILRRTTYENNPLIIDIEDKVNVFSRHGTARRRFYRKSRKPDYNVSLYMKDLEDGDLISYGIKKKTKNFKNKNNDLIDIIGNKCIL